MEKSPEKIKTQLEFWFFKYFNKDREEFNGKEEFTLFDLVNDDLKNELILKINLKSDEIPVFLLRIDKENFIVNTTERFLKVDETIIEEIHYCDFLRHEGYIDVISIRKNFREIVDVKTEGLIKEFGIMKVNETILHWKIPTGTPGFAFWNVTKRCELIGRKYLK